MKVYTYIPPNNGKVSQSNNGNLSQEAKLILEELNILFMGVY